jgi:hypothetical protein
VLLLALSGWSKKKLEGFCQAAAFAKAQEISVPSGM